jgi:hypothetical protein
MPNDAPAPPSADKQSARPEDVSAAPASDRPAASDGALTRAVLPPWPEKPRPARYRIIVWQRRYPDVTSEWTHVALLLEAYTTLEGARAAAREMEPNPHDGYLRYVAVEAPE